MERSAAIYWYSQTGNSFLCARWAREIFEEHGWATGFGPMVKATDVDREAGLLVFVLHLINFDIPVAVKRFVKRLPRGGAPTRAVALITYHGMAANAPWLLSRLLRKRNIELTSYKLVRAENSEIPVRRALPAHILYGKPDQDSRQELRQYLESNVLAGLVPTPARFHPFDFFHWVGAMSPGWAPRTMLGKRVAHAERCKNCGMCYTLCPVGALTYDEAARVVRYSKRECIGCCGCLNVCPQNVWETSWFSAAHYYKKNHAAEMYRALLRGVEPLRAPARHVGDVNVEGEGSSPRTSA